jgi:hypothetical protein
MGSKTSGRKSQSLNSRLTILLEPQIRAQLEAIASRLNANSQKEITTSGLVRYAIKKVIEELK